MWYNKCELQDEHIATLSRVYLESWNFFKLMRTFHKWSLNYFAHLNEAGFFKGMNLKLMILYVCKFFLNYQMQHRYIIPQILPTMASVLMIQLCTYSKICDLANSFLIHIVQCCINVYVEVLYWYYNCYCITRLQYMSIYLFSIGKKINEN